MIALPLTGLEEKVLMSVYFKAMLEGSFLGTKMPEEGPFPGWSKDRYYADNFSVVDCWGPHPDIEGTSKGIIVISYKDVAIWTMQYEGHYPDDSDVIKTLKYKLRHTFQWAVFEGGRGRSDDPYDDSLYRYENDCAFADFGRFSGREKIWNIETEEELGFHTYSGGYLF